MVRKVTETKVEDYEKPMATATKKRHKIASVDLTQDSPFRVDCQIDDQKYLAVKNRNPQLEAITKASLIRSTKELSRVDSPLSSKARVLNEIVREASGVHSYTLVPPIKDKSHNSKLVSKTLASDPETNPVLKPYRDENNRNPVMSTFGHRPSSGGRTFNPATMKIRLGHGEVVQAGSKTKKGGNTFGLPAAILSQLLHCPRLEHPSTPPASFTEGSSGFVSMGTRNPADFGDLFLPPEEMAVLFAKSTSKASLGPLRGPQKKISSSSAGSLLTGIRSHKIIKRPKDIYEESIRTQRTLAPINTQQQQQQQQYKPAWDGNLAQMDRPKYEIYGLKKSAIADSQLIPLKEKFTRFAARSVSDSEALFCEEKRMTDKMIAAAAQSSNATKRAQFNGNTGDNGYRDPELEREIRSIKQLHEDQEREREDRVRVREHIRVMDTIPKVNYQPEEALKKMKRQQKRAQRSSELMQSTRLSLDEAGKDGSALDGDVSVEESLRMASKGRLSESESVYMSESGRRSTGGGSRAVSSEGLSRRSRGGSRSAKTSVDEDLFQAIEATKAGDEDALFDFFMRASATGGSPGKEQALGSPEKRTGAGAGAGSSSLGRLSRHNSYGSVDRVEEGDESAEDWEGFEGEDVPSQEQESQANVSSMEHLFSQGRQGDDQDEDGEVVGGADEGDEYADELYEEDDEARGPSRAERRKSKSGTWAGDAGLAEHMDAYDDDVYTGAGLEEWEDTSGQFDS